MYRKAKRDKNEKHIVDFLRRVGATVAYIDAPGIPDLLVGYRGVTTLIEIKSKRGKLTQPQKEFFDSWQGTCHIVRSTTDAKKVLRQCQL